VGPGCVPVPSPAGTPAGDPTPGDCQRLACDGAGNAVGAPDDGDLPPSTNPCKPAGCPGGMPSWTNAARGTACGAGQVCDGTGDCVTGASCEFAADCPGTDTSCSARACQQRICAVVHAPPGTACEGGLRCNGAGLCGCTTAADCPGPSTACVTHDCMSQVCLSILAPAGTFVSDPVPGDCHSQQCDGNAHEVSAVDDRDLPADGNDCTYDWCSGGVPSNPPKGAWEPCPGGTCDGAGTCLLGKMNGCTRATATDLTGSASATVTFPGTAPTPAYAPACLAVKAGTAVTFSATAPSTFDLYPLMGGVVVMMTPVPATSGPFFPVTDSGASATFTMSATGDYPYYCTAEPLTMQGVVYVVP
jgi:plastocyanin